MILHQQSDIPSRSIENLVICISGTGSNKGFSVLMTDQVPDLQLQMNGQCFPMFLYETEEAAK
ncbi:type ISP restriction/modification enzyme [Neisseria perflava]|uniref:type ISP restriction/modification enzyme n=1 Tax=Neisseria perflava TaxID=33053 RepID=UPI00143909CF